MCMHTTLTGSFGHVQHSSPHRAPDLSLARRLRAARSGEQRESSSAFLHAAAHAEAGRRTIVAHRRVLLLRLHAAATVITKYAKGVLVRRQPPCLHASKPQRSPGTVLEHAAVRAIHLPAPLHLALQHDSIREQPCAPPPLVDPAAIEPSPEPYPREVLVGVSSPCMPSLAPAPHRPRRSARRRHARAAVALTEDWTSDWPEGLGIPFALWTACLATARAIVASLILVHSLRLPPSRAASPAKPSSPRRSLASSRVLSLLAPRSQKVALLPSMTPSLLAASSVGKDTSMLTQRSTPFASRCSVGARLDARCAADIPSWGQPVRAIPVSTSLPESKRDRQGMTDVRHGHINSIASGHLQPLHVCGGARTG
mmetsp:Transcript_23593/g.63957  ORF Transcript_23593/g.63957 Transcript_23593/m.63957 type:complete len:369 (-) Transcript_23593:587-1693(-)